jgi:hypothetical protein
LKTNEKIRVKSIQEDKKNHENIINKDGNREGERKDK